MPETPEPARSVPNPEREPAGYRVAVVGATGLVGIEMLSQLEARNFPVRELVPFGSERSAGTMVAFRKELITVQELTAGNCQGFDIALFSAGADVSREWAPRFAADGCYVIDNSSAWRMHPEVPLIVAGVNDHALDRHLRREGLIHEARGVGKQLEQRGIKRWAVLEHPDGTIELRIDDGQEADS